LSEKEKNEKKLDDHGSTQKKKKKKKKNQEPKKWSLEKKACFCQNKRQIVLLFYPFCLNQGGRMIVQ